MGYVGYSMSENAASAYRCGEMPLSKWAKADIMEAISNSEVELNCSTENLKKLPVKTMKQELLYNSSWHHTSSHFNKTNFYRLDEDRLAELTDAEIDRLLEESKKPKTEKKEPEDEKWECAFLEWSGTRNHPKATRRVEEGTIKGDWFFRKDGSKKKISANGFEKLRRVIQVR